MRSMKKMILRVATLMFVLLMSHGIWAADVSKGYVVTSAIWQVNAENEHVEIPVCWVDDTLDDPLGFEVEREWVRTKIAATWEANSRVRFTGWEECGFNNYDKVRILIFEAVPRVLWYGPRITYYDGFGMILNLTFESSLWSGCPSKRYCIEATAVHEFGHVLGFSHEQNRPDTPETCEILPHGQSGDMMIGDWDLYSVMNYCNPNYSGNGDLSETDVLMVQTFYGSPNIGPIAKLSDNHHSVILDGTVTFDASASYDPDGAPLLYNWHFGDTNEIITTSGSSISHAFMQEGKFATILTVDDGAFVSEPVYAEVNVYDPVKIVSIIINTLLH